MRGKERMAGPMKPHHPSIREQRQVVKEMHLQQQLADNAVHETHCRRSPLISHALQDLVIHISQRNSPALPLLRVTFPGQNLAASMQTTVSESDKTIASAIESNFFLLQASPTHPLPSDS